MRGKLLAALVVFAGGLMLSGSAFAHHGAVGFDNSKRLTVKGTVTEFIWTNPHAQINMDAKDENGNVVHWGLELNSPGNLTNLGWNHSSLKVGDEVTASFYPGKENRTVGDCVNIVKLDGTKLPDCMVKGAPEAPTN